MKLYNTLTRLIEVIKPQQPPAVKVYSCGPTVYDYSHVGHWFTYVRTDTLIRALKANGFQPDWIMNITDVGHLVSDADEGEDKLEKGARREGKTAWEVAKFYTEDFIDGTKQLNLTQPTKLVKATDHIEEQISLIKKLEDKNHTYIIDDGVYYDTSKFPSYADFALLNLAAQQATERVVTNPQKHQAADFALWKFSPKDHQRDMEWDSPWGKGFPGWHIECSAMSMKYLGDTLDIHTGGVDHIPVHHTNEIAQSEAATGQLFVRHWFHTNHVLVDGQKISKSLGNGIRLQDVIAKGFTPAVLRLHILESHYRSQAQFSWDNLQAAQNRLNDLKAMAVLRWQPHANTIGNQSPNFDNTAQELVKHLANDLDTPAAVALLSQVSAQVLTDLVSPEVLKDFEALLQTINELFGLNLLDIPNISQTQKQLIKEREKAREAQDWILADKLRQQLAGDGIGLRDTSAGAIWYPAE